MSNFRWGLIAAFSAFFVSAFLGIISDVRIFHIFIRALIFGAVFFGLGFGLRFVLNSFFPELLYKDEAAAALEEQLGSRVDITLDSSGEYAVPELFKSSNESDELGNIEDLISGSFKPNIAEQDVKIPAMVTTGIDADEEAGYNDVDDFDLQDTSVFERPIDKEPEVEKQAVFQPQFTPSFGDDSGLGGLPDLDMMARAFSSFGNASDSIPSVPVPSVPVAPLPSVPSMSQAEDLEPAPVRYVGNKPQPLDGDFDPRSLAEGIRTVLSKD